MDVSLKQSKKIDIPLVITEVPVTRFVVLQRLYVLAFRKVWITRAHSLLKQEKFSLKRILMGSKQFFHRINAAKDVVTENGAFDSVGMSHLIVKRMFHAET